MRWLFVCGLFCQLAVAGEVKTVGDWMQREAEKKWQLDIQLPLAEKGDYEAEGYVCMIYYKRADYANSLKWCQLSAKKGNLWAELYLGAHYYHGNGVGRNDSKAYKWLLLFSSLNNKNEAANKMLATLERRLNTTEKANVHLILGNSQSRKETEPPEGQDFRYREWRDHEAQFKAFEHYQIAADYGNPDAMRSLGRIYLRGIKHGKYSDDNTDFKMITLVDVDRGKAVKMYQKAANLGSDIAKLEVAVVYLRAMPKTMDNAIYAKDSLQKLIDDADFPAPLKRQARGIIGESYRLIAAILLKNKDSDDKAFEWLEKAANNGDVKAMLEICDLHVMGRNQTIPHQRVYMWRHVVKLANPGVEFTRAKAVLEGLTEQQKAAAEAEAKAWLDAFNANRS